MTTRSRKILLVVIAIVCAGAAAGGSFWWRREQRREQIVARLPVPPDLTGRADYLVRRIRETTDRIKSGSDPVDALGELCSLYQANGFLDEALTCYPILEALQPSEPRWFHRHASILAGYGETEPALALWQHVIDLAPDYIPARLRVGDLYLKSNQLEKATDVYGAILKLKPGEPYAQLGLARVDFSAERWEQARARLEKIVAETHYQLGYDLIVTVYQHLGEKKLADAVIAQTEASGAYRDPTDPWLNELNESCFDPYRLLLASGAALDRGDKTTAVRLLERAASLAPKDVTPRFQLGLTHLRTGSLPQARDAFEQCTKISPDFPDGWAQLSAVQKSMGDPAAATRTVLTGLQYCPKSPGLHLMRARQLKEAGRTDEAMEEARKSIELRPNEAAAYLELALMCIEHQRTDEALDALHRAVEAEPANPMVLGLLTFQAIQSGNEIEAQKWLARSRDQPRFEHEQMNRLVAAFRERFGHDAR